MKLLNVLYVVDVQKIRKDNIQGSQRTIIKDIFGNLDIVIVTHYDPQSN